MALYNFRERFAPKVESGEKLHTIRRRRKRRTQIGEKLYLYTGLRTKNARKLRPDNPKCTAVRDIVIDLGGIAIDGRELSSSEVARLAVKDGFNDVADFYEFWRTVHGLTPDKPLTEFELIEWEPKAVAT